MKKIIIAIVVGLITLVGNQINQKYKLGLDVQGLAKEVGDQVEQRTNKTEKDEGGEMYQDTEMADQKEQSASSEKVLTTEPAAQNGTCNGKAGVITKVFDGDTYDVQFGSNVSRVRLVGINTPEADGPYRDTECGGAEASEFAKSEFSKDSVCFSHDETQAKQDQYDRLLGYLSNENGDLGQQLIAAGFAESYAYRGKSFENQTVYEAAERKAQDPATGLWKTCERPFY